MFFFSNTVYINQDFYNILDATATFVIESMKGIIISLSYPYICMFPNTGQKTM